jgi:hypothetical protein
VKRPTTCATSGLAIAVLALALAGCGLIGAGTGASAGEDLDSPTGYRAGRGALIGTGVGSVAGAIYDITQHESD